MDRAALADFLRVRREALQPADVGFTAGPRRRTSGLRREEVAALAGVSADYYARIEQQRGPEPSVQVIATIARALRLDLDERDHLYRLAGHAVPPRARRTDFVHPALLRVLDRLDDTPAMIVSDLAETLAQNRMAVALMGEQTGYAGLERSMYYRWFLGAEGEFGSTDDRDEQDAIHASNLRAAIDRGGADARSRALVSALLERSERFRTVWARHEVGRGHSETKVGVHPELGRIEVYCQRMSSEDGAQSLLVFTAVPGSESAGKLALLGVIGADAVAP
jgi:transcriptional regulator with XRE-family HTH domain